jgi:hypothetical protein
MEFDRSLSMPALATAAAALSAIRADFEQLQGSWTSVAGRRDARFLIAGHRFAFEFVGGEIYIGTFDLGEGGRMDMHVQEGPEDHRGQVAPCIYHIEGGVFRWCPGRIGSGQQPRSFPSVDDDRHICLVFRRVPRRNRK